MKMSIVFNSTVNLADCVNGLISDFDFVPTEEKGVFVRESDGISFKGVDNVLYLEGDEETVTKFYRDEISPAYGFEIRKSFMYESCRAFVESMRPKRGQFKNAFKAMKNHALNDYLLDESMEILNSNGVITEK